ncbi:hypothetical protein HPP92_009147 [Vanilla planifolia]|uniref:Uncharacterized protein n=1 Tax=Vanilla planifolia TaxID=51239 RepID=A0A835RJ68_VANPL|nr:hypothetical protein HPP92_009147 [Vanilla planifolia]
MSRLRSCEIGANTCIDRGSWRDTVVGDYTKIDNLVQIGHNVIIGKCCMLCGQVGIAGSVTMGDYCTLGGRVAVKDHCAISSKVRVAGNSFYKGYSSTWRLWWLPSDANSPMEERNCKH